MKPSTYFLLNFLTTCVLKTRPINIFTFVSFINTNIVYNKCLKINIVHAQIICIFNILQINISSNLLND